MTNTQRQVYETRQQQWREYYALDWRERRKTNIQPFNEFLKTQPHVSPVMAEWIRINARKFARESSIVFVRESSRPYAEGFSVNDKGEQINTLWATSW